MANKTFSLVRQTRIPSLNLNVEEYRHQATEARHLHLAAEDNNNAFLVAFLTMPQDSTGVAHILEHTSLCGSRHYPVRDPFFMMERRSLNTFMNAFTSSDWTAYPFASQNIKDFENLLQVYLDAAFFPNLHELDFAQEGHRVEFTTPNDPNTPLVYKGVVFNEMKGSMSSPVQCLLQKLTHYLFPTITYHHNHGGEPLEIPRLTHEQLKIFHARHYHPSNAIFMTYGDQPAEKHQSLFETQVLKYFQPLNFTWQIPDEQRYQQPQQFTTYYPIDETDTHNKTHIILAWLWGYSMNARDIMRANLLTGLLLDHSASPLRHALETTTLGTAPSPLCGLNDHTREAHFVCGLEGSNLEQADEVEQFILQILSDVAREGVPPEQIESVLHQIELSQREITGNHFPYGLHLLLNAMSPMLHGGDPLTFLDIDPALIELRQDCQQPDFIPNLIKNWLLENPHRVRVVMAPDPQLAERQLAAEQAQLNALQAAMTPAEKAKIIEQTAALQARQQQADDPELLPKVDLTDIPNDLMIPEGQSRPINGFPATWFTAGTNGMVYQRLVLDLPDLAPELLEVLPLFCDCVTEVGYGEKDYLQIAAQQAAVTGGINAQISLRGSISDVQTIRSVFSLSGKALVRNQAALSELLQATLETARFDELNRLRELISQIRTDMESSLTARGHQLALMAASSGINPTGYFNHHWYGLAGLRTLKALDDSFKEPTRLAEFATKLVQIQQHLLTAPRQFLIVSEATVQQDIAQTVSQLKWQSSPSTPSTSFQPTPVNFSVQQAWNINTQVNFCAKTYATVPYQHPDAPTLMVLGQFLRHGYLHRALREQGGAYGGGAAYDNDTGTFRFYSYRDPRLEETLADFDASLSWLQNHSHQPRSLEEAILTTISRIDRPLSPAGEAISAFFSQIHGRTPEKRRAFRQRILQVSLEDLQSVAQKYLQPTQAHVAVVSDAKRLEKVSDLGLERQSL
jgi:Zn-dependent M16 (insulinase) family peptidase